MIATLELTTDKLNCADEVLGILAHEEIKIILYKGDKKYLEFGNVAKEMLNNVWNIFLAARRDNIVAVRQEYPVYELSIRRIK
jgi:hypothetical protein